MSILTTNKNYKQLIDYGKKLLIQLSKDLTLNFGKGFSRSNLQYMRLLY